MPFSFRPGIIKHTLTIGTLLLVCMLIPAGCERLDVAPTPSSTVAIDPSLFPAKTVFSPPLSASSTPSSPGAVISQAVDDTPVPRQLDRIVLSFAQAGHEHLFAYFPLSQPFAQLTSGEFDDRDPAISPDGTRLAFSSNRDGYWDLYLLNLSTLEVSQLTQSQAYDGAPSWSPDGQWLTYETYNGTNFDILVIPVVDQSLPAVQITQDMGNNFSPRWSPAGREIVFVTDRSGSNEIWLARLDVAEERFVKLMGASDISYTSPTWSPDGTTLAWTRTVQGSSTVETAPVANLSTGVRSYGSGSNPIWSQDGSAILVQLQDPNASYLVAYRVEDGVLLFPAEYFPSPIHGMDWRTASLVNQYPSSDAQPITEPAYPLWQNSSSARSGFTERQNLSPIPSVKAPYPYLLPAAVEPFQALREETNRQLGWDFLGTLDDAVLPISAPPQPGISENWLFTGRAINVNAAPLSADWMTVSREDIRGMVYWRVWVRCFNQDGSCGEPQKEPEWDFSSRYTGDASAYEEGGKAGSIPTGYWVDFTRIALANGFERPAALNNWRSYFQGTLFNQFILKQSLSWQDAMLQLYPADVIASMSGDIPLPVQQ